MDMTGNIADTRATEMEELVRNLADALCARQSMLATAESCTGGLVAHELTNMPGSSRWYGGGVVAYSNLVKQTLLKVPEEVILAHGAVSAETVLAMAAGARKLLQTEAALAVSGIAGPDGGTPDKPVGTVWMAWSVNDAAHALCYRFSGSRREIKRQSALAALEGLLAMFSSPDGDLPHPPQPKARHALLHRLAAE